MVILVDNSDQPTGSMDKLPAHEQGLLHRAFSVFIFNTQGQLLVQQRALGKYHTPGQWANTCCSHPLPDQATHEAAIQRLWDEMGMQADIEYLFKFTYKAHFDNGLTEHEIDHIFAGISNALPAINPAEVNAYRYMSLAEIKADMTKEPHKYTAWFSLLITRFEPQLQAYLQSKLPEHNTPHPLP